jgi:hypothetical protein
VTGVNKCDPDSLTNGYIANAEGEIEPSNSYVTTDYINVSDFQYGYFINKHFRKFLAYNDSKVPISASYIENDQQAGVVTYNSAYKYIRVTLYADDINNAMISDSLAAESYVPFERVLKSGLNALNDVTSEGVVTNVDDYLFISGKNKCNPSTYENGFISGGDGTISASNSYMTTDFIDVSDFQYGYAINKKYRKYLAYDSNKVSIPSSYHEDGNAGVITLDASYKYLRFTLYTNDMTNVMIEDSASITEYEPYKRTLINGVSALNDVTGAEVDAKINANGRNFLYGTKWYACGDSFTAGDFSGLSDGYTFEDEPYMGYNKVYPYFIGRRCLMDIVNLAVGGMTMAKVTGSSNNFCESVYQNVGVDADYITLKFGINDGHQSVPIGTIDSSDITTFYGAWNTVMTWLITNRPTAKIGIIVSNGLDSNDYADATITIAKKYGVPYLNEWRGEQVPLLIRSGRTDVADSIKTIRNETFRVSSTNLHPNVVCHEYESTFVEEWLKSL